MDEILKLVYELNATIITAQSFSDVGNKIVEILSKRVPMEWMSLGIIKEDKIYISAVSSKIPSYFKEGEIIPLEGTASEHVIKTASILYEKDLSKEQKFWTDKYHYQTGIRSIVRIPLLFKGKVFAIWVIASDKPNAYTEKDIELLKLIASQISIPLRSFLFYDETKKQAELFKTVNKLAQIVHSDININSVFKKFAEELKKYVPFERLSIGIVEGKNIKYAAVSEVIRTGRFEGTSIPLKYTASQWVIKNKKTLVRKDLIKEKEFPLEEKKVKQGIRSTLHVPLIYKGKVFGTINLSSVKPNAYGEWEKMVLETLVSQISSIIAISYLYSPFYNHLTEVYNRRYFDEKIDEEIKYRERYGGGFCVCLCDLDDFKRYNDSYGHIEGDNCLREVAIIMKENIRKTDLVFRYGGDEFAIIMPNTSLEEAIKVSERLKNAIKERMEDKGITISIGIASYPIDGRTRTEIIDKADRRLLKAKETKNLIVYKD